MSAERAVFGLSLAWLVGGAIYASLSPWAVETELRVLAWTGWGAVGFLIAALGASPLQRIAERVGKKWKVAATRRALGLAAAAWASLHFVAAVAGFVGPAWTGILHRAYLRAGLIAMVILVCLALTSFPRVVRALRVPLWKELHRLAYVAAICAVLHVVRAPYVTWWLAMVIAGVIGVGFVLRLVPRR